MSTNTDPPNGFSGDTEHVLKLPGPFTALSGSSIFPQQPLEPSQSLKLGALKVVVSFFRDCSEKYSEGDADSSQRRTTVYSLKVASHTQIIEEQLQPLLCPTCEITLSKTQTFGKITFESQDLISKVHVVLDNKELLLRKPLLLL